MSADDTAVGSASTGGAWKTSTAVCVTLGAIAVVALGLRLGYVLSTEAKLIFPDESQYVNIAQNFATGHGLRTSTNPLTGHVVEFEVQRPPVYPLMLAVVFRLGGNVRAVQVVQAVLGALTCLMIYVLAKELMGEWPARIAGAVSAVYPFYIYFAGRVLSETLFLLLFVTSWYYVVRMWRELNEREAWTRWVASCLLAGLLGAAAALTRSEALAVFVLVPVVMVLTGPRRWMGLALGMLMLVVLSVGLSPWVTRNYRLTTIRTHAGDTVRPGAFIPTTLKVGESLYDAVGPWANGAPNKENTGWPQHARELERDEYARDQYLFDEAVRYMRAHKKRTVRLAGIKLIRMWNIFPNYEEGRTPLLMTISAVAYIPVILTALVGLWAAMRRPALVFWLMVPVMVLTVVHVIFLGSIRYRMAMMPFVMVLSGAGAWWLACKWLKRRRGTTEP